MKSTVVFNMITETDIHKLQEAIVLILCAANTPMGKRARYLDLRDAIEQVNMKFGGKRLTQLPDRDTIDSR